MKNVSHYLNFGGNCREVMEFYQQIFGGTLNFMTFDQMPNGEPNPNGDKIMHATLTSGPFMLMASDDVEGRMPCGTGSAWIMVDCESEEELRTFWAGLSPGGMEFMAPNTTFWGAVFAMCQDKYKTNWMLNFELPK